LLADAAGKSHDLPRQVGRATITATFARLFGANPSQLPVATVLRAAPAFWRRYHDWCGLTAAVDDKQAAIAIDGEPGAIVTCELVAGELARVVELAGGADVKIAHPTCRCMGGAKCEYRLDWA
jgi:hypothetical protein